MLLAVFPLLAEIPVWQLSEDGGFIVLGGCCFLNFSIQMACGNILKIQGGD